MLIEFTLSINNALISSKDKEQLSIYGLLSYWLLKLSAQVDPS